MEPRNARRYNRVETTSPGAREYLQSSGFNRRKPIVITGPIAVESCPVVQ
jgi:hypothetical protein